MTIRISRAYVENSLRALARSLIFNEFDVGRVRHMRLRACIYEYTRMYVIIVYIGLNFIVSLMAHDL